MLGGNKGGQSTGKNIDHAETHYQSDVMIYGQLLWTNTHTQQLIDLVILTIEVKFSKHLLFSSYSPLQSIMATHRILDTMAIKVSVQRQEEIICLQTVSLTTPTSNVIIDRCVRRGVYFSIVTHPRMMVA